MSASLPHTVIKQCKQGDRCTSYTGVATQICWRPRVDPPKSPGTFGNSRNQRGPAYPRGFLASGARQLRRRHFKTSLGFQSSWKAVGPFSSRRFLTNLSYAYICDSCDEAIPAFVLQHRQLFYRGKRNISYLRMAPLNLGPDPARSLETPNGAAKRENGELCGLAAAWETSINWMK